MRSTSTAGFWYQARAYVWVVSVSSSTGFVPIFNGADHDTRFLGVRVKPMLGRMSRIAVVTSSPPMVEGGHMVIARSLVAGAPRRRALRRHHRHAAEPVRPPGVRVPRDLADRRRIEPTASPSIR